MVNLIKMLIFINLQAAEAAVKAIGCGKKEERAQSFVLKKSSEKII